MMLNSDVDISKFTDPHATEDERLDAGMSFMSHLYYEKWWNLLDLWDTHFLVRNKRHLHLKAPTYW